MKLINLFISLRELLIFLSLFFLCLKISTNTPHRDCQYRQKQRFHHL